MATLIPKFEQTGVTTVNRPISQKLAEWVSVKDFGAVGDGVADDTAAIQAALDSAVDVAIFFPKGIYKVTSCLNNTNGYRSLFGPSGSISVGINSTSTDYIIDNTGTNWGVIEGISFNSSTARVGVYYNRSSEAGFDFCQNNVLRNCRFELGTAPSASGGVGRVCYYNRASENNLIDNCQFHSDVPAILAANTNASFLPIYTTEGGASSMTRVEFNSCVFFAYTTNTAAIKLQNVGTITVLSSYIGCPTTGGSPVPAIDTNVMDGCSLQFHIEGYTQALKVTSLCQGSYLNFYMQYPSTLGTIQLNNGNTALTTFAGNNVLIKTGETGSSSNIGVYSAQSQANTFIVSNIVNTSGGTFTPILYTNLDTAVGTNNISNLEISQGLQGKFNSCQQVCFYGADVQNGVSAAFAIPVEARLVKITMGYAVRNGSTNYHTYQYTIPVWGGVAQYVASVSLGSSGSNNDFTYTLVGNVLTISTSSQLGTGVAVYEVITYYR
jgi:hypothetical protein